MAFLSGSIADAASLRAPYGLAAGLLSIAAVLSLAVRERAPGADSPATRALHRAFAEAVRSLAVPALRWARQGARAERVRAARGVADPPVSPGGAKVANSSLPLTPLLASAFLWTLATGAVYAVWANYMVSELGYTQAAMTRLWSLASTTEFPLMIVAGWLSDRIGRLPMLSLGFVAWTVVFAGYVLFPQMPWIIGVQLVRGFAYSAYTATAMTYATEVRSRAQRGWVSGLYSTSGSVGSILGAAMGGVQTEWMGFRAMIGTNAGLVFAGALYVAGVAGLRRKRARQDAARAR
jgi:predicted MFS family arabinose efflux permease